VPCTRVGSYVVSPCLTAARFVRAPPIPTTSSGLGQLSRTARSGPKSVEGGRERPRQPDRPDRSARSPPRHRHHAEPLLDPLPVTEGELRAASPGLEDDERPREPAETAIAAIVRWMSLDETGPRTPGPGRERDGRPVQVTTRLFSATTTPTVVGDGDGGRRWLRAVLVYRAAGKAVGNLYVDGDGDGEWRSGERAT
jgi:hypothetical protein